LNEGKVFTEVTDEGRAFQTVGAARLKALSARIVLEEGTASRFLLARPRLRPRPKLQDQDQDQDQMYKTKTKTEAGLRPVLS